MRFSDIRSTLVASVLSLMVVALGGWMYPPQNVIAWDSFGYYMYLPQLLIHNDLDLKDQDALRHRMEGNITTSTFYQANELPDGRWQLRYTSGMAIMYLPGFVAGHVAAKLGMAEAHGYSRPYHQGILWWSLLVAVTGIWTLRAVLLRFLSDSRSAFVLALIVLGTNYMVHVTLAGQAVMPHNYLFTGYALLILLTMRWTESPHMASALGIGAICGLMILARPTEAVCLAIPILWGVNDAATLRHRMRKLLEEHWQLLSSLAVMTAIGSIQFIYWMWVSGSFISFTYGGSVHEAFDFDSPHILDVLFSYRKGWLLYTPIMALALIGIFKSGLLRQHRWAIASYFLFNLYVISSWHNWWYAESFSQRSLIASYPVMALGLGGLLSGPGTVRNLVTVVAASLLMGLNLFQSWQFQQGIIDASRMTRAYYWKVFGATKVDAETKDLLLVDRSQELIHTIPDPHRYRRLLWEHQDYEAPTGNEWVVQDSAYSFSGRFSGHLPPATEFSPAIRARYWEFTAAPHMWLRLSVMVRPGLDPDSHPFNLVITNVNSGVSYGYWADGSKDKGMRVGEWNLFTTDKLTPDMRSTDDEISLYVWNQGRNDLWLDDLKVEFFQPLELP